MSPINKAARRISREMTITERTALLFAARPEGATVYPSEETIALAYSLVDKGLVRWESKDAITATDTGRFLVEFWEETNGGIFFA